MSLLLTDTRQKEIQKSRSDRLIFGKNSKAKNKQ
jgi:hypothetical protein